MNNKYFAYFATTVNNFNDYFKIYVEENCPFIENNLVGLDFKKLKNLKRTQMEEESNSIFWNSYG